MVARIVSDTIISGGNPSCPGTRITVALPKVSERP